MSAEQSSMFDASPGKPVVPEDQSLPDPFHGRDFLAHEFLLWLWFRSERDFGTFRLSEPIGSLEIWLDDKLTFLALEEKRIVSAFNGGAPSTTLEARLSVVSGKVIQEARLGMRQGEAEWSFLLRVRGGDIQMHGLKIPAVLKDGVEEMIYERVVLLQLIHRVLEGLFSRFFEERTSPAWQERSVAEMRAWLLGDDG